MRKFASDFGKFILRTSYLETTYWSGLRNLSEKHAGNTHGRDTLIIVASLACHRGILILPATQPFHEIPLRQLHIHSRGNVRFNRTCESFCDFARDTRAAKPRVFSRSLPDRVSIVRRSENFGPNKLVLA